MWTSESKRAWGLAVFDGAGEASDYCGNMIGEYQIDNMQADDSYVYKIRGGISYLHKIGSEWVVQDWKKGGPVTCLKNESNTITPPSTGWLYNKNGTFVLDPSLFLSITPRTEDQCQVIMITSTSGAAARFPEYLGTFTRSDRYLDGRPVFSNSNGKYLRIVKGYNNWGVGDSPTKPTSQICSASSSLCPAAEQARSNGRADVELKSWFYVSATGDSKEDTTITVKCDRHKDN